MTPLALLAGLALSPDVIDTTLAELLTSTGPLGGLVVYAWLTMRSEMRSQFETLRERLAGIERTAAETAARVGILERRQAYPESERVTV